MGNLISVVVNVGNAEKNLENCIENIMSQTYKNLEILIINNNKAVENLNIYNNKVKIINQKNIDKINLVDIGINNTKGDYLYFVDAHDFIDRDLIEILYDLCINYNVELATCESFDVYNYNYKENEIREKVEIISGYQMINKVMINDREDFLWNKLIKRNLLENEYINGINVLFKIILSLDRIAFSNQKKYCYCREGRSTLLKKKIDFKFARKVFSFKLKIKQLLYN